MDVGTSRRVRYRTIADGNWSIQRKEECFLYQSMSEFITGMFYILLLLLLCSVKVKTYWSLIDTHPKCEPKQVIFSSEKLLRKIKLTSTEVSTKF